MTGRVRVSAPQAGVYLLVHPEMWPSNDPDVTRELLESVTCIALDDASRRCTRRVVLDDGTVEDTIDSFGEALLGGVLDIANWERLTASPQEIPVRVR